MRRQLFMAASVAVLFVAGAPAFSQEDVGSAGITGVYDRPGGRDYGFENMKADTRRKAKTSDELAIGADLVKQEKFAEAIPHLELALTRKPNNSTTLIYLGFSHRMIGSDFTGAARADEYNKALGYYQQAVAIDPDNRLLHEYMGKLYLLMRDQPLADSELKTLEKLCPSGCAERDTLSNVMLAYMASTPPSRAPSPATPPPAK